MVWFVPLIAAAAQIGSSIMNSNSARRAGNARSAEERALLDKVEGVGKKYYEPYVDRGNQAQDQASATYQQMLQNPTTFVEQIMNSYKPSQGYQFRQNNALNAARNSAAAGGFSGTSYDQQQQAGLADGLLSQDMQQYLQNILGVQGTGLAGQQHVGDTGYQASSSLADYIGNAYGNQATLRQAQNKQGAADQAGRGALFSQLLGQGTNLLGSFLGSGSASGIGGGGGASSFLGGGFGGFK